MEDSRLQPATVAGMTTERQTTCGPRRQSVHGRSPGRFSIGVSVMCSPVSDPLCFMIYCSGKVTKRGVGSETGLGQQFLIDAAGETPHGAVA